MKTLSALLFLALPTGAWCADLPPPPTFGTVEILNDHCLACHSAEMVLTQPKLPKPGWQAVVTKMVKVYKAPLEEQAIPAIVEALEKLKPQ